MKQSLRIFLVGLTAGAVLLPMAASSHHSAAMFDSEKELVMTGTVSKFDYLNPHSWLYVDIKNEDGSVTSWGFELEAPPRLRRIGVGPKNWVAGDLITVKTNPLRDGRPAGNLVGAIKQDGSTFGEAKDLTAPTE